VKLAKAGKAGAAGAQKREIIKNLNSIAFLILVAINVLRDSAEYQKMPSGIAIDRTTVDLNTDAANILAESLDQLRGSEHQVPASNQTMALHR